MHISDDEFERAIEQVLDDLPERFARVLENVGIVVADEPNERELATMSNPCGELLGLYEGIPVTKRTTGYSLSLIHIWHLDAQLGQIDMYSLGWKAYLHQRVVDEERRRREREVAEKKADRLMKQGIRLHAKATKAVAAQNMMRRAEKLLENTSEAQKAEKVADIRFPEPAPCGRTPIMAKDISKAYGSNIVFAGVNLAIDKGSRVVILGYNGAGKTPTLRLPVSYTHLPPPSRKTNSGSWRSCTARASPPHCVTPAVRILTAPAGSWPPRSGSFGD